MGCRAARATSGQFDEWECPLTGASVERTCGLQYFDEGECVPRVALAVMEGRQAMPTGQLEGPVRLGMAAIEKRRNHPQMNTDGHGSKKRRTAMAELNTAEMSLEQLLELAAKLRKQATAMRREVRRVEGQRGRLEPTLKKRLGVLLDKKQMFNTRIDAKIVEVTEKLEALAAGKAIASKPLTQAQLAAKRKGLARARATLAHMNARAEPVIYGVPPGTRAWTPEEEATMLRLREEGKTGPQIARELGRPLAAVYTRIGLLKRRAPAKEVDG